MRKVENQKKRNKKKIKKMIRNVIVAILLIFASFWIYKTYSKIDVQPEENIINIQRTSQAIEEITQNDNKIEEMIEEANHSVVGISKIKNNGSSIFAKNGVNQLGIGTGFIVSENGYIVTNEHVSGAKFSNCYVTLENGRTYNANVVWSDSSLDISIIKINMKSLSYIKLGDSDEMKVGQSVYAIGNPIGFEFQRTVTSGIISALSRTFKFEEDGQEVFMSNLLQTDAGINPGNSGGPLINVKGQVIGINSIKIDTAEGIGFAIPINIVKPIIQKYKEDGSFEEATMGIFAYDKQVIPYIDSNFSLESGIYVEQVIKNNPAEKAGIKVGDIITKIDGIELNKMCDLKEYIYTKAPNDEVIVTIQRGNNTSNVTVKLIAK